MNSGAGDRCPQPGAGQGRQVAEIDGEIALMRDSDELMLRSDGAYQLCCGGEEARYTHADTLTCASALARTLEDTFLSLCLVSYEPIGGSP